MNSMNFDAPVHFRLKRSTARNATRKLPLSGVNAKGVELT
tara:strand:- start:12 stop:131 length:120 start_codon:yes stop_codon:yes gene_type:complete